MGGDASQLPRLKLTLGALPRCLHSDATLLGKQQHPALVSHLFGLPEA
jgi:hypothetical protein